MLYLVAFAGIAAWVFVPVFKMIAYVCTSPRIHSVRRRAVAASALLLCLFVSAIVWAPLPLRTRAEGVIWIPEQAHLRAQGLALGCRETAPSAGGSETAPRASAAVLTASRPDASGSRPRSHRFLQGRRSRTRHGCGTG